MNAQAVFPGRRQAVLLIVAVLLLIAGLTLSTVLRRNTQPGSPTHTALTFAELASLHAAAEEGDDAALASFVEALHHWTAPEASPLVAKMLGSKAPTVRAAACAWIGKRGEANLARLLFARLSDADWRVRAAAFDAIGRVAGDSSHGPTSPAPLRDTPVDERETLIFAWINAWRTAGDTQPALPPLPDHCELYAPAGGNWLAGAKLAESCLACHAPPSAQTTHDAARCAACHREAHADWSASSHAQSTSHLNLLRVDERTKTVTRFDHGSRQGLVCTTCHVIAAAGADARPVPQGTENIDPPHRFEVGAAAASCVMCHADTHAQWKTWRTNPRPIASTWLAGDVSVDASPDVRTCVSCHMPPRSGGASGLRHGFLSRRDATFMRDGLSARIEPPTARRGPQLVLTNLAGHAYPSGTGRRGLRIEIGYDDEETKRLLTRLTDSTVPTTQPTQSALRAAEQRRIDLPVPAGASRVTCTITYERNHYEAGAYELLLHELSERVTAPVAPSAEAFR